MRSSSSNSQKKRPLVGVKDQKKYSDYFESKVAIQRIAAERQNRDAGLSLLYGFVTPSEKSKTTPTNHQTYESAKPRHSVTNPSYRIPSKHGSQENENIRLNDQLYSNQKELQLTRDTLSETQQRYEKIVKDLKYYINEIESENLKLTKEVSGLRQVNKREVDSIQDRDNRILTDYHKRVKDLEDQSKFYVQENIKLKQAHEKEILQMKYLLKDAESKLENFKKEFSTFHNKSKKDVDELAFKDEYIKKMQEGIKEKSKAIFDLRQANEQYLKFLEEKEQKVQNLEKEIKKEKESNRFYSERLNELMIEKINEGKKNDKDRVKGLPAKKMLVNNKSSNSFEIENKFGKGQNAANKSLENEKKTKIADSVQELESKNLALINENSVLRKEVKELGDKLKVTEEANKSFKAIVGKNAKGKEQTPRGRLSEGKKKQGDSDIQVRLNETLRKNEIIEKSYNELIVELDSFKKQQADSETLIKILKDKCARMKIEQDEYTEERKIFQKRSNSEKDLAKELENIKESINKGKKLLRLNLKSSNQTLSEDLEEIWMYSLRSIQELEESIQQLDEENQFLSEENKQFQLHIEEITEKSSKHESVFKENSELHKKVSALLKNEEYFKDIKTLVKNLKVSVGLTYQERGIEGIVEDLEDTLIEVEKIMQNENELSDKLNETAAEFMKLKEEVMDLRKNEEMLENANEEITVLIEKNQKLEELLEKSRENEEDYQESEKYKEQSGRNKSLEEILLDENQNLDELRAKCQKLEEENENLALVQRDYEKMLVKYTVLKEDKRTWEEQAGKFEEMQSKLEELEMENEQLKGLEGKVKEISEELNKSLSLEQDLGSVSGKYETLLRENEELQEKFRQLNAKYEKQLEESSEFWEVKGKLQSALKENQNLKGLSSEYEKLVQQFQELDQQHSDLQEKYSEISQLNSELQKNSSTLTNTVDNSDQLEAIMQENQKLAEKNSKFSEEIEKLKDECEVHGREKFELEEKLAQLEYLMEKKNDKIEKYRVGSRSLERKLSRTENKTQLVLDKVDKEKQEILEKLSSDIEELKSQRSRLSTDNNFLEDEVSKKDEEISSLLEELSKNRKELKNYIKLNEKLEDQVEQIQEELEVYKKGAGEKGDKEEVSISLDYNEKVELLIEYKAIDDSLVGELKAEIQELKLKLEKTEKNLEREAKEAVELTIIYETDEKVQIIYELEQEIQALKGQLEEHETVDLNIHYESDEKVQELNDCHQEIKHQERLIQDLKETAEQTYWQLKEKNENIANTQLQIEELNKDIQEKQNIIEGLKKESSDWQLKYNKLAFSESSPSSGSDD